MKERQVGWTGMMGVERFRFDLAPILGNRLDRKRMTEAGGFSVLNERLSGKPGLTLVRWTPPTAFPENWWAVPALRGFDPVPCIRRSPWRPCAGARSNPALASRR
jgi:hypothetical protein